MIAALGTIPTRDRIVNVDSLLLKSLLLHEFLVVAEPRPCG